MSFNVLFVSSPLRTSNHNCKSTPWIILFCICENIALQWFLFPFKALNSGQTEGEDLEGLPVDMIPTTEEDDDVFEPEPTTPVAGVDGTSVSIGGKRRTQSLSSIQSGKEPQSPLKVS